MQHDEVLVEGLAKCCLPRSEGIFRDGQLVVTSRQLVWEPFEPGQAKLDLAVTGITGTFLPSLSSRFVQHNICNTTASQAHSKSLRPNRC